jgi:glucose/arabinose dehydrogenase
MLTLLTLLALLLVPSGARSEAATAPGFRDVTVMQGLTQPTVVRFAPDGRVFVAEKSGKIKVLSSVGDTAPKLFADLSASVHDYWDRGLLGLALPPDFPTNPYVYVLYAYDAPIGGRAPTWGDGCPDPPGGNTDGCVVSGRLSRLQAAGDQMTGTEQVLVNDWCQQYPSHSVGDLAFSADGKALYVSGGDGASYNGVDYGQLGASRTPNNANPCGDPPGSAGSPLTLPSAQGGALRSQSVRRPSGQPVLLNGTILRLDPATGLGLPGNPYASSTDVNARRIVASGLRNPYRFAVQPSTGDIWTGDVGWNDVEEINRVRNPANSASPNFGWPCYEGNARQGGYAPLGLSSCTALYNSSGAVTGPVFSYPHSGQTVAGDGCPTGGSSLTGVAFNTGSRYPAAYTGALFFADYSRACIWAMQTDETGTPSPSKVSALITGAAGPVNLQMGPDGYLYYVDLGGGTVHRVEYGTPPPPPPAGEGVHVGSLTPVTSVNGYGPVEVDRSNGEDGAGDGRTLTLNGQAFAKGLGVHANSEVSYTVPQGCTSFTSRIGVDDEVGAQGSTVFSVFAGSTRLYASNVLTGASATATVDVPVTAGTVLRLVVGDSGDGNAFDHGDWADARFVCGSTTPPPPPPPPPPAGEGVHVGSLTPVTSVNGYGPVEVDRSNGEDGAGDGRTLTLNGQAFAKGLGVHANSEVSYTVPQGCTSFTSRIGVDDEVGAQGSTVFSVFAGSTRLYASNVLTGASATATVDVPVTAGTVLRLVVGDSGDGNAFDHGDWADARFMCGSTTPPPPPPPPPTGNRPPVLTVGSPDASRTWAVGDTISFAGSAVDPEDGTVPGDRLSWSVDLLHCPAGQCHSHTVSTVVGGTGTVRAPDHDYPSYLQLTFTATDSQGARTSSVLRLDPKTVDLTFTTNPGGLKLAGLAVGSGETGTPFTKTFIVGSSTSVTAPSPQVAKSGTYVFRSWSDGGAQSHQITAPAAPTTYTATYRKR